MLDLVSMGDLMIDFSCVGKNDEGRLLFERNPGGAPMNVAHSCLVWAEKQV